MTGTLAYRHTTGERHITDLPVKATRRRFYQAAKRQYVNVEGAHLAGPGLLLLRAGKYSAPSSRIIASTQPTTQHGSAGIGSGIPFSGKYFPLSLLFVLLRRLQLVCGVQGPEVSAAESPSLWHGCGCQRLATTLRCFLFERLEVTHLLIPDTCAGQGHVSEDWMDFC